MNENVGASFGLSVLVVVFFAVALFEPEGGRPQRTAGETSAEPEPVEAHPPVPEPTRIEAPQAARPGPVAMTKRAIPVAKKANPPVVAARRVEPKSLAPRAPAGPFTEALSGETLEDVAWRVYGSDRAVESLRKANRDLMRGEDVPLVAGALIRTP